MFHSPNPSQGLSETLQQNKDYNKTRPTKEQSLQQNKAYNRTKPKKKRAYSALHQMAIQNKVQTITQQHTTTIFFNTLKITITK